jgi:hypothetical protein
MHSREEDPQAALEEYRNVHTPMRRHTPDSSSDDGTEEVFTSGRPMDRASNSSSSTIDAAALDRMLAGGRPESAVQQPLPLPAPQASSSPRSRSSSSFANSMLGELSAVVKRPDFPAYAQSISQMQRVRASEPGIGVVSKEQAQVRMALHAHECACALHA